MTSKLTTAGALCILSLALSGCLETEGNLVNSAADDQPTSGDSSGGSTGGTGGGSSGGSSGGSTGGSTGGSGSGSTGGGSTGGGSTGGGTPPPPPTATIDSIPDVPFDYMKEPGAATTSGGLPSTIGAGEVLDFTGQSANGDVSMTCAGTEQDPAFIVGGTLSGSSDVFRISGSWCYFIGTEFRSVQPRPQGDHMVFRNVDIHSNSKNGTNVSGSNIVITDSEIHHNQKTTNESHGIQASSGADGVWILNNLAHHNSGDSLQGCHGCSSNPPRNIYIGGNTFYSDRENAVDFKWIENVVVEGNVFYGYKSAPADSNWCFDDNSRCATWNSGSDGSAVVIGSDGTPTGVVIKDNEIYNSNNAIRVEEGVDIQIVGNMQYDLSGRCLQLDKEGHNLLYQGNSCINAGRGIFQNWRENFSLTVDRNVFENISGPAIEYESGSVCDDSTLTSNTFTGIESVICNKTVATTTAAVNALPGAAGNTVN
ncbi:MAG: right-handed parallel beta-helix repeat-containing protein [Gammaproteobacteria bacterium]|nr:right-handed parallel beta-helix repeat-containing protein [Gammaproteobacteria bacterium]